MSIIFARICCLNLQGVQEKLRFFLHIRFIILPPLPCKHCAAIGCTGCTEMGKISQPKNLLQRYVGEGWVAVDNEKTQFFPNNL